MAQKPAYEATGDATIDDTRAQISGWIRQIRAAKKMTPPDINVGAQIEADAKRVIETFGDYPHPSREAARESTELLTQFLAEINDLLIRYQAHLNAATGR